MTRSIIECKPCFLVQYVSLYPCTNERWPSSRPIYTQRWHRHWPTRIWKKHRERDRERHTQTERDRQTKRETPKHKVWDRHTDKHTELTNIQTVNRMISKRQSTYAGGHRSWEKQFDTTINKQNGSSTTQWLLRTCLTVCMLLHVDLLSKFSFTSHQFNTRCWFITLMARVHRSSEMLARQSILGSNF